MTNDECRQEAIRRVEESDRLFENLAVECARRSRTADELYREVAHLRQTAAVFAALAGPKETDPS